MIEEHMPKIVLNKTQIKEDNERGQQETKNLIVSDQRKLENKALFARQLQSIQKTIATQDTKEKNIIGYGLTEPKYPIKHELKADSKATAFAGSGIMSDMMKTNDEFMITSMDKEESKHASNIDSMKNNIGSSKDSSSMNHFGKSKRTNSGFRTSAAAMFSNQTGGKWAFTDFN